MKTSREYATVYLVVVHELVEPYLVLVVVNVKLNVLVHPPFLI